jgi:putative IMPACT (imprinted ancient) family translation regulator
VVRYFGGVKLGVGGLVNAYRTSAAEAISSARIIEIDVTETFSIRYKYNDTSEVMKLLKDVDANIIEQEFDEGCRVKFAVKVGSVETFLHRLKLIQDLGVNCVIELDET